MKINYKFNYFEPILITSFWALLFASPLLFGRFEDQIEWPIVITVWLNFLPLLIVFFINRFVLLPKLFFKGKKISYFISTFLMIVFLALGIHMFNENGRKNRPLPYPSHKTTLQNPPQNNFNRLPPKARPVEPNPVPIPYFLNFIILAVLLVGFDTGLKIAIRWSRLEQEKIKLQKENIENQLAFLKNQISPHFFMNTLNNIHALVDIDTEEAKHAIIKLSNLMRHLLYDSEGTKTPIKKEIQFIESYIELMRLRFSEKVKITVTIPTIVPDKTIPPLLFTSLLENAFKHGISYKSESFINLNLSFTDTSLIFNIENSKQFNKKNNSASGIGIENTKKRLFLLFKDTYNFTITDSEKIFSVTLTIPL